MEGWIKLHRGLLEWEWYDEPNVFRLFLHCILKANHSDKSWRGSVIKRGEFVTSLQNLSNETKLSVQQVRTCLKKLTNELTIKSTSQHTVIQVVKYNEYQDDNKQSNKRVTNEQQTNNKQITTTKNDKNNNNSILSFDDFWNLYDFKVGSKTKLEKKYASISEQDRQKIKNHVPMYIASQPEKQFRKRPATYLNNESWNDEIVGQEKVEQDKKWLERNSKDVGTVRDIF